MVKVHGDPLISRTSQALWSNEKNNIYLKVEPVSGMDDYMYIESANYNMKKYFFKEN